MSSHSGLESTPNRLLSFLDPDLPEVNLSKRRPWSAQFADRFHCAVSDSLADWLDQEIWRHQLPGEFCHPVHPERLLDSAPECVWPGLMHCDLIPLLGNDNGDWLCLRIDDQGSTDEIVHWYHGGGDWIPWGRSLAEAVLFDSLIEHLPGSSRPHAQPAEPVKRSRSEGLGPVFGWIREHLPNVAPDVFQHPPTGDELVRLLLQAGVAEVAVRSESILDLLTHPERDHLLAAFREEASAIRLAEWSFDVGRVPDPQLQRARENGLELKDVQQWDAAIRHVNRVAEIHPELSWPWDLRGYAAERSGDTVTAVGSYHQAAKCSVFTDQSIRFETHWASDQFAKFSVARLNAIVPAEVAESAYYQALTGPDTHQRRIRVTEYWLAQAETAASNDRDRLSCLTAAAWDVGVDSIPRYASILEQIAATAAQLNQVARAELASTHRRCLHDRYGH